MGSAHDVLRGRGLQPARVPQRHGLAPRQFADRARARPLPTLAGGSEDRASHVAGGRVPRSPAAGGVRGHAAGGDAVPDRVSHRRAAPGVGGGDPDPPVARAAGARAVAPPADARDGGAGGAAFLGGSAAAGRACRASTGAGRSASTTATSGSSPSESRSHQSGVVPRAADRLRRHRVDRVAARRWAGRRRRRRHALRVGRLTHEGEARVGVQDGAERVDRHVDRRAPPLPPLLRARRRVRCHQRPLRAAGRGARRSAPDADSAHRPRPARRDRRRRLRADRARLSAGGTDLDLHEPADAASRICPGRRTARTRSTSRSIP